MIYSEYCRQALDYLRKTGIEIAPGLPEKAFKQLDDRYGLEIPPDLRALLSFGVPRGSGFTRWDDLDRIIVRFFMDNAWDGILFDIEQSDFWLGSWGAKPSDMAQREVIARSIFDKAPRLIPVYMHRCLVVHPCESGNPIFSIHQSDIIIYGNDLSSYLEAEFGVPNPFPVPPAPKVIPYWSEFTG